MKPLTRLGVAYHEAVHAVMAQIHGDKFGASVFESEGGALSGLAGEDGRIDTPPTPCTYQSQGDYRGGEFLTLLADAAMRAAGAVAQSIAAKDLNSNAVFLSGHDGVEVTGIATAVLGGCPSYEEIQAFRSLAIARAWRELSLRWYIVEAVAKTLEERGRLSSDEVKEIMKRTEERAREQREAAGM